MNNDQPSPRIHLQRCPNLRAFTSKGDQTTKLPTELLPTKSIPILTRLPDNDTTNVTERHITTIRFPVCKGVLENEYTTRTNIRTRHLYSYQLLAFYSIHAPDSNLCSLIIIDNQFVNLQYSPMGYYAAQECISVRVSILKRFSLSLSLSLNSRSQHVMRDAPK